VAHQKLVAAAAAGRLPDVMQMGSSWLGEFADMGALEPVDTKVFQKGDFFPAAWQEGTYDGKTYGVPWYVDTRVLFYRTDLFEQAGISAPPQTMAELLEDAKQLNLDTNGDGRIDRGEFNEVHVQEPGQSASGASAGGQQQ